MAKKPKGEKDKSKGKLLKREMPEIFNFDTVGDYLEGVFTGVQGKEEYRTFVFEQCKTSDGSADKLSVWMKAALEQVMNQMKPGGVYRLEYVGDIPTKRGFKVKDIEVRELF